MTLSTIFYFFPLVFQMNQISNDKYDCTSKCRGGNFGFQVVSVFVQDQFVKTTLYWNWLLGWFGRFCITIGFCPNISGCESVRVSGRVLMNTPKLMCKDLWEHFLCLLTTIEVEICDRKISRFQYLAQIKCLECDYGDLGKS